MGRLRVEDRMQTGLFLPLLLLIPCPDTQAATWKLLNQTIEPVPAVHGRYARSADSRPSSQCIPVPAHLCAVGYDSATCRSSGWKLDIPEGRISFRFWSSWWSYRNDMDTVGVRDGCTFIGYSNDEFNGNMITIRAQGSDMWVVFERVSQYAHMAEDIEAVSCHCNR